MMMEVSEIGTMCHQSTSLPETRLDRPDARAVGDEEHPVQIEEQGPGLGEAELPTFTDFTVVICTVSLLKDTSF